MKPGFKQDFIRIDIADPGDYRLVEEKAFESAAPVSKKRPKTLRLQLQRLRPEIPEFGRGLNPGGFRHPDKTELADIPESKLFGQLLKRHDQTRMLVYGDLFGTQEKLAGHLKVKEQAPATGKIHQDHFAATAQSDDAFPLYLPRSRSSIKSKQRRMKDSQRSHAAADEMRPQTADDGLNFRQLRHPFILSHGRGYSQHSSGETAGIYNEYG